MKKLKSNTIRKLKPYWKKLQELEGEFNIKIHELEIKMQNEIGIEDLEFFGVMVMVIVVLVIFHEPLN